MRVLLKILLSGLLLVVLLAVGAEVVALHHSKLPDPAQASPAVVVRKAARDNTPPKSVCPVPATAKKLGHGRYGPGSAGKPHEAFPAHNPASK